MTKAAIGIREHSGWGVLVAVSDASGLEVVLRKRMELLADGLPGQPFHAAARMRLEEARVLVEAASASARDCAAAALGEAVRELCERGHEVAAVGAGVGLTPISAPFDKVMASHALLHASEGEMYRDAIAEGAEALGLTVSRAPRREVWAQLSAELGMSPNAVRDRVAGLRAMVGAPWGSDEKEAAAAAWLALVRAEA